MITKVKIVSGKSWVIGDIHGRYDKLKLLLQEISPTKHDALCFVGDYIDRGPDSKYVLDEIMRLERRHAVYPLLGNHCLMLLYAYYDKMYQSLWIEKYGAETLKSFRAKTPLDIDPKYILWIKNLALIARAKNFVISHAGVDFYQQNPFEDTATNRTNILFRGSVSAHPTGKYRLVIGHQARDLEFIKKAATSNVVYVDGGCGKRESGRLVAFCLDDNSIISV